MTAQVSHEIDYQVGIGNANGANQQVVHVHAEKHHDGAHHQHGHQAKQNEY